MADSVTITSNVADGNTLDVNIAEGVSITTSVNESTQVTANVVTGAKGDPGDAGPVGDTGPQGPAGATGATGAGVVTGGTANQALTKIDGTDYNTQWETIDKTFVGLGNVDNTSDATKNAATATLTNKTINLTSNTLTGTTAQFNTALSDGDFVTIPSTTDLSSWLTTFSATINSSQSYAEPAAGDVTNFLKGLRCEIQGTSSGTLLTALGFTVTTGYDSVSNRPYTLIVNETGTSRSWGAYLIDRSQAPSVILEAPHPVYDANSESIALQAWQKIPGAILLIAGAERTCPSGTNLADVAHQTGSLFHKVAIEFAQQGVPQIQIHGYADATDASYDVIISQGDSNVGTLHKDIARQYESTGLRVARGWDGTATVLLGTTNSQGDAALAYGSVFVHIEHNNTLRSSSSLRTAAAKSIAAVDVDHAILNLANAVTGQYPSAVGSANTAGTSEYSARADHVHKLTSNTPANNDTVMRVSGAWQSQTPTQAKTILSLENVDNTSDINKPVSTATQTALDDKVTKNSSITGATKTKVTYDAKGLVTAGADATTADIADSTNKRYVTDAQLTVIGNTSGTNTGDQDLSNYVTLNGTQTLTNKTINLTSNTLTGTTAQFNTALSDGDFATLAGTQTLTNKTLTSPVISTSMDARDAPITVGSTADVIGTGIAVTRNAVQVGRIDNNASGLRVQAQSGALQLRGTGNTGISVDSSGVATLASAQGSATNTIVATDHTQTLTNKRVTKRTGTTTSSATPTINTDNYDVYTITAMSAAVTSMTTNLSGTPSTGDELLIGFKDNGTPRAITWGSSFVSSGVATLLATTATSKQHWVKLMWDGAHWVCLAVDATGY